MANFLMGWWFVAILIVIIILLLKFKNIKHKFFLVFLILFILFLYVSVNAVASGRNINLSSFSGFVAAGKAYYSWLGSAFQNVKVVVGNALKMDWGGNKTAVGEK